MESRIFHIQKNYIPPELHMKNSGKTREQFLVEMDVITTRAKLASLAFSKTDLVLEEI